MECSNSCVDQEKPDQMLNIYNQLPVSSLNQRKSRIRQHKLSKSTKRINSIFLSNKNNNNELINEIEKPVNDAKSACLHDNKIHQFNATWSPFSCTLCRCTYNSIVECFVKDCPSLANCSVRHSVSIILFIVNIAFFFVCCCCCCIQTESRTKAQRVLSNMSGNNFLHGQSNGI